MAGTGILRLVVLGKPGARNTPKFCKNSLQFTILYLQLCNFYPPAAIQFLSAPGAANDFLQKSLDFAKSRKDLQICKNCCKCKI